MAVQEQKVRDAATALYDAIVAAKKAGLVIDWPRRAEELPRIGISEGAAAQDAKPSANTAKAAKKAATASKSSDKVNS